MNLLMLVVALQRQKRSMLVASGQLPPEGRNARGETRLRDPEVLGPLRSGTKNQPKEEVLGRASLGTSDQKLRSGHPNPGKNKHFGMDIPRGRP